MSPITLIVTNPIINAILIVVAFFNLELSLVLVSLVSSIIIFDHKGILEASKENVEPFIKETKMLFGQKVNILNEKSKGYCGPAFAIGTEVYIQLDSEKLVITEGVVHHEACHAMHNDSRTSMFMRQAALLLSVLVASCIGDMVSGFWTTFVVLMVTANFAGVLVKVFTNMMYKYLEVRADMYAVKMSGNSDMADALEGTVKTHVVLAFLFSAYPPLPLRIWIIRTYSNIVNG